MFGIINMVNPHKALKYQINYVSLQDYEKQCI